MKHRLRLVGRLICWREGDGVATRRGSRPAETRGVIASSCVQSGGTAQPPLNPGAHPSPSRLLSGPLFTGCGQPRHPCPTGTVAGGGAGGEAAFSLIPLCSAPPGLCTFLLKGKLWFSKPHIPAKSVCCAYMQTDTWGCGRPGIIPKCVLQDGQCLVSSDVLSPLDNIYSLALYCCTNDGSELFEGESMGCRGELNSSW